MINVNVPLNRGRKDGQNLSECLYDKPSVINRKANLNINRFSGCRGKLLVVLPYVMKCVRLRRSSSITKWAARISREWFDLESPNFTRTSTPAYSAATPDVAWPTTSGRELSRKNCRKCRLWPLRVEFEWRGVLPAPPIGGLLVIFSETTNAIAASKCNKT